VNRSLAASILASVFFASPAQADDRWPVWPTEVDRLTERLFDVAGTPESERTAAFWRLHQYATPLISKAAVKAAADPAVQIRSEALELCRLREIKACIPAAVRAWNSAADVSERMKALAVIALDPSEARALVLFGALRDPDERIRWSAVRLIARAPFSTETRDEARNQLLAKLTDAASRVRADAAEGLALLGGNESSLAIVRLLDDPDPLVREAAARALGRFADDRAKPALLRAIDRGGTPHFVRAAIASLAQLPGEDVDEELLRLFDQPMQRSATRADAAEAIGRRAEPSDLLVRGMIDRLREDDLRLHAVNALLRMGATAVPALKRARDRGLEPSLAMEVDRLLDAQDLPDKAPKMKIERPARSDRAGWHVLLARHDGALTDAAAGELAQAPPEWLEGSIVRAIATAGRPSQARPFLVALATSKQPMLRNRSAAFEWMKLVAWASDPRGSAEDRCLAIAAAAAAPKRHTREIRTELLRLTDDSPAAVRACLAMHLGRLDLQGPLLLLLRDPAPAVRAGAALGAASLRRPGRETLSTLVAQSSADEATEARGSATWALARIEAGTQSEPSVIIRREHARVWDAPPNWLTVRADGVTIHVPTVGPPGRRAASGTPFVDDAGRQWALVPGLHATAAQERTSKRHSPSSGPR
jgi:HEAT repeat protein